MTVKRYVKLESGELKLDDGFLLQRAEIEESESLTIPEGYQMLVGGGFTVSGELTVEGELHVVS